MGAYQKFRGDPEQKLFYLLSDFLGGINTEFSDDNSSDIDFESIINFDMDKLEVNHFQTICYSENVCRPAGKFYKDEHDRIVRPVQNCKEGYGKGTLLYEVKMVDGKFVEKQIYEYDNSLFLIQNQKSVDNFHTYSLTNKYEVVDFIWKRFDLLKKIKWQIRKYKRYKRHSK